MNNWIERNENIPVNLEDHVIVQVEFRTGFKQINSVAAFFWGWSLSNKPYGIVRYRILSDAEKAAWELGKL